MWFSVKDGASYLRYMPLTEILYQFESGTCVCYIIGYQNFGTSHVDSVGYGGQDNRHRESFVNANIELDTHSEGIFDPDRVAQCSTDKETSSGN